MKNKELTILNLYPKDMNIYGDRGNVLCLKKRIEGYGYTANVIAYNQGDTFPDNVDIVIGGGGQDSGQKKIQDDLIKIGPKLAKLAESGTPMLVICGLYQLFGNFFRTVNDEIIPGIGILNVDTFGKSERLIGNIRIYSEEFGDIIGYENHSGQTYLGKNVMALGRVKLGAGNNLGDVTEGARFKNVIGSYMHGSLLPNNPRVADFLIKQAAIKKYGSFEPIKKPNDEIANQARKFAMKRPR